MRVSVEQHACAYARESDDDDDDDDDDGCIPMFMMGMATCCALSIDTTL